MSSFFHQLQHTIRLADVADILVVSILLYLGLQWVRRRATRSVAAAMGMLAVVYVGARVLDMHLTLMVFQTGVTVLVVSLVVIFQHDIRRTFEQLSSWRGFQGNKSSENWAGFVDDLIETSSTLAKRKIGALIVLVGRQPLEPHIEGGVVVKGRISTPLLMSIFHPATPGHDGAVIIDRERIEMLGAYLPLSHNLDRIGKGGTRHAAALGLCELCDTLVIVVSEERGTISLAEQGELEVQDSIGALQERLETFYHAKYPTSRNHSLARSWRRHLALKLLSLSLAGMLWFFAAYRPEATKGTTFEEVSLEFRKVPNHLTLDTPDPARVKVALNGSILAFANANDLKNLKISIDLNKFNEGEHDIELDKSFLRLPSGLTVERFDPPAIKITLKRKDAVGAMTGGP